MRILVFAMALASFGAPVSSSFVTGLTVPDPAAVKVTGLPALVQTAGRAVQHPQVTAAPTGGLSEQFVRFDGRRLSLAVMHSGDAGVAVLSVPEGSPVPSLPQISVAAFQALAASHTVCRAQGAVATLKGRDGPVALTTGLDCSGSGF